MYSAKLQMMEAYISTDAVPVSVEAMSFETYSGDMFESHFASVTFSRVNAKYFKMTALYHQGSHLSPDELKTLIQFNVVDRNGNILQLKEVKNVIVFGEDEQGYAIAKPIKVPETATYLLPPVVEYHHLVVTGVHGNFKDKKRADARAKNLRLHHQDAKVIRVKA